MLKADVLRGQMFSDCCDWANVSHWFYRFPRHCLRKTCENTRDCISTNFRKSFVSYFDSFTYMYISRKGGRQGWIGATACCLQLLCCPQRAPRLQCRSPRQWRNIVEKPSRETPPRQKTPNSSHLWQCFQCVQYLRPPAYTIQCSRAFSRLCPNRSI